MIHHTLAKQIDIHGGGMDLIFPHHENEIAQSEGVSQAPFVKYWMHHNMFELEGQKISKSLGHTKTMQSFLKEYGAEVFKYLVLSSHYRSVSEISKKTIYHAIAGLYRIYQSLNEAKQILSTPPTSPTLSKTLLEPLRKARSDLEFALNDDLNTAKAFSACFTLIRFFNDSIIKNPSSTFAHLFLNFFKEYGSIFSLFQEEPKKMLFHLDSLLLKETQYSREEVNQLVKEREQARMTKDFQKSDQMRDLLNHSGIEVQDTKNKTTWRMQPSFFIKKDFTPD